LIDPLEFSGQTRSAGLANFEVTPPHFARCTASCASFGVLNDDLRQLQPGEPVLEVAATARFHENYLVLPKG
jgi:hypothetical protein